MHKYFTISFVSLVLFCTGIPSYGYAQPIPPNKKQEVENLNERVKGAEAEKQSLERKAVEAKQDYKKTQKELIEISASVQKNESELNKLETRLSTLKEEQKVIETDIQSERVAMAQTISALEHIRRTPPEAMIARPQAPIDTARGAMLLKRILPVLQAKTQSLKEKSTAYKRNQEELQSKQKKLVGLSADLSKKEKTLKKLVDERKSYYASVNTDIKQREADISKLSKQAKSLNDLVSKLEDERTQNAARVAASQHKSKPIKEAALPSIGESQLPLRGVIRTHYNEDDDFGAKSQGVSIEGRGGALIVAPMGGIIRFAGYFKNYGNMVIIEHQNGYHSLIAGLEKIDTVVDQKISAGEPLGHLYNTSNGKLPTLYFELRHKGKAIDPARKFTELG